jgi:hypothetical protein
VELTIGDDVKCDTTILSSPVHFTRTLGVGPQHNLYNQVILTKIRKIFVHKNRAFSGGIEVETL